MISEKQRKERSEYIGASDCAAVLGLSRWRTPLQIWGEKTGAMRQDDITENLAIEVGTELEELVCKLFAKRTGKEVRRVNETQTHPKYPFIRCNIDRRVVGEDAVLEAKTASAWKAKEWEGEEVPQEYILQCLHQLAVTGKKVAYIAVLIGGNHSFVFKKIERDEKIIDEIISQEVKFWKEFVEKNVIPTTIKRQDSDALFTLFPNGNENEVPVELGEKADRIMDNISALGKDMKNLEGILDQQKNEIKALLGDNSFGGTQKWKVSWKNQVRSGLDMEALKREMPEVYEKFKKTSISRVLRISAQEKVNGL